MAVQGGNPKKRSFSTYDKKPSTGYDKKSNNNGNYKGNNGNGNYSKSKPDFKGKGKFTPKPKGSEKEEPRRKRPITSGGGEEELDLDYDEVEAEADGDGDVAMDGPEGGEPAEKKPRMSKSEKAALHAAQPHRTALLPSYPLLQDTLLPLWETARKTDSPKEERTKAVKELYQAVKGRILEISKGHKGGRVLQTVSPYLFSRV